MADEGLALARRQLLDLVQVAGGAVELLDETEVHGHLVFTISLDTSGLDPSPTGITVRSRERFKVAVSADFPFTEPTVFSDHTRWAKTPHVQWGNLLCLYAAPSVEWNPADGMRGFIARLSEWVERAVAGTLDPEGQPLHPPAVYASASEGKVLIHPDLGVLAPWAGEKDGIPGHPVGGDRRTGASSASALLAWCVVRPRRRIDVLDWVDVPTAQARSTVGDGFHEGHPLLVLPVVLINDEFGFEFPEDVKTLSAGLAMSGYDRERLVSDLAVATAINRALRERQLAHPTRLAGEPWDDGTDQTAPLVTAMLVGTPSRRVQGTARLAHLAAWRVDAFSAQLADLIGQVSGLGQTAKTVELDARLRELVDGWLHEAEISWMWVMEARPEVTLRRDHGTPLAWLNGKRVLVLGCGALGAPIAEFCARAGVSELTVADQSVVMPGILIRQPYTDADIGRPKATVLSQRLSRIRSELDVTGNVGDVRKTFLGSNADFTNYDLVIDATADASVRAVIEKSRKSLAYRPPLVTVVIGHDARRGLAVLNLPTASGAGADTFRKVARLKASRTHGWTDIVDDFFPEEARTDLFFPEPGCSSPTFVGSAAQTAALAGEMLNEALTTLHQTEPSTDTSSEPAPSSFAFAVRIGTASAELGTTRTHWMKDHVQQDASGEFEVRVSGEAIAELRAEVRRGARTREPGIETGGMLLGAFDDSTGIIHVDTVSGPPPDSYLSETYFQHGLEGAQQRVDTENDRTGRATGFVGFWHTHPDHEAYPSETDEQGMASIVGPDGTARRALMMILGGEPRCWTAWRDAAEGATPDIYLRVIPRTRQAITVNHVNYVGGLDLQELPAGSYYRGRPGGRVQVRKGGHVITTRKPQPIKRRIRLWPWKRS